MGLPRAIKAHAINQLQEAEVHYRRAYAQGNTNEIFYQNFGALLKKIGKTNEAKVLFEEGLKLYPKHAGIKRNYANLLRNERPSFSVELYIEAIQLTIDNPDVCDFCISCCDDLVELLRINNLFYWSQSLLQYCLCISKPTPTILKNILLILDRLSVPPDSKKIVLSAINNELAAASLTDAVSLDFALASHYLADIQHERSIHYFERALERVKSSPLIEPSDGAILQNLIDTNSWNFACALLPLHKFERGWSLFDHGLRTPADGQQKWQRALFKPFSASDLPIWRGQYAPTKRLLLLDEQAIGDCMMFVTLVPALLSEFKHIGLFVSSRLEVIYKRSFEQEILNHKIAIFTKDNLIDGSLSPSDFDFQIPLGSICQHRFTKLDSYAPRVPILTADEGLALQLREVYLANSTSDKQLIGISWRGGGRGKRIQEKSLDVHLFAKLMLRHPHIRFVDLQYGKTTDQIKAWSDAGIDIISDPNINPLKDMNSWLSQVKACDAVVSVANTTIHGAGGLNIPTQCLLSLHSDWRWLADPVIKRSYWYPSVGIARERRESQSTWSNALQQVSDWIDNGCPMPSGTTHLSMP